MLQQAVNIPDGCRPVKRTTRNILATIVLAGGLAITTQGAHAFTDSGPYIAGGLGASLVNLEDAEDDIRAAVPPNATRSSVESDDGSPALSLGAGFRFTEYVSAEVNYYNAGEFEVNGEASGGGSTETRTDKISFDGFGARVIGHIPLHRQWTIDVSAGVAHMDAEREIDQFQPGSERRTSSVTIPTFGIGTQFHVNRYWSIRGMFTHFNEVRDGSTTEGDVNMVTAGAAYRF